MAQQTVFYSWQSDLPNGTNRTFIETCLNKAIKGLRVAQPHLDPSLDRDTANVPGSPDIAATILDKIDNCQVFVCDISIVQHGQRSMPNPNVVFELGYAVKRLGWDRVICIANEHFGTVESLPFDVRQRRVKCYTLSPDTADRNEVAKALTRELGRELEFVLTASQEEGEKLQLQIGDIETKTPLGNVLEHVAVFYSCDREAIPDYRYDDRGEPFGGISVRVGRANKDYNRELAQYIQQSVMLRKVGFVAFNGNRKAINDLTMKIVFPKSHGLFVIDDEPSKPAQSETDKFMQAITPISAHFARPGKVSLEELPDRYELRVDFGKVQPEANAWSEPVFIGAEESCNLEVAAALYGDELTAPRQIKLGFNFKVTEKPMGELPNEEWARLVMDS